MRGKAIPLVARSLIEMYRLDVVSSKGKSLGRVADVLFHPSRNEIVGYVVARPRLGMVIDLPDRYLARDRATIDGELLRASAEAGTWDAPAAKRLGIDWDVSVIWAGMPVRTQSGARLGEVRDALFEPETGMLKTLGLSGGVVADAAVGTRDLPASLVIGFDGEAVVVSDEGAARQTSGGAAAAAGRGAAVAKKTAGDAADRASEVAIKAASYGAAAVKVAAQSDTGKKTIGWLKKMKDAAVDAMGEDEG